MLWLGRVKRYAMLMSPPFTRGSTRTAPTPSAIRRSSLNPSTSPWGRILASPPWTFFPLLVCSTPSCPCAVAKNSPFLCVVPVSRKNMPNPCCVAPIIILIPTPIARYANLVHPRAGQSCGKGAHPRQDPRSLPFSPRATPDGSLCRLRQHMVKVKNKNRQGGRVGVRPWSRNGTIFFATRNGRASD